MTSPWAAIWDDTLSNDNLVKSHEPTMVAMTTDGNSCAHVKLNPHLFLITLSCLLL